LLESSYLRCVELPRQSPASGSTDEGECCLLLMAGSAFTGRRRQVLACLGHLGRGVSDRRAQELFPARKATHYLFAAALLTRSSTMARLIGLAK
jgi:hypothetical protein